MRSSWLGRRHAQIRFPPPYGTAVLRIAQARGSCWSTDQLPPAFRHKYLVMDVDLILRHALFLLLANF
jgi:hypothetical protein